MLRRCAPVLCNAHRELYHTLDRALSSPKRLSALLQYISYDSRQVQVQAVLLAQRLAVRLPALIELLQPSYDDSEVVALRQGYAQVCVSGFRV
jgi:hypothetical protein